jgi:rSAM/selenodomain-associated transferase 1
VPGRAPRRADARAALVVLAKHPIPGRVKTRLASAIGAKPACELYDAFVRDLAARLRRGRLDVWWAYSPATAPFGALVRSRRCFPQRGADLGARIHHAIARVARATRGPVIAIGADAPHVSLRELRRAAGLLARRVDVVIGPARDGGYYLIGVRRPSRALFTAVPWSTASVLAATRRRCRALRLRVATVAPGFDVDAVEDLRALARHVRTRRRSLPATYAALSHLRRSRVGHPPSWMASA